MDRGDRYQRVPVVGRSDNGDFGPFALQELAEIFIASGLRATKLFDVRGGGVELVRVHVARGDDRRRPRGHRRVQDVHAPPARADERDPELLRLLAEDGRESVKREPRARRGLDESSACGFHKSPAFAKINSRFPIASFDFAHSSTMLTVSLPKGGNDSEAKWAPPPISRRAIIARSRRRGTPGGRHRREALATPERRERRLTLCPRVVYWDFDTRPGTQSRDEDRIQPPPLRARHQKPRHSPFKISTKLESRESGSRDVQERLGD